jgi:hypothetical protein
VSKEGIRASPDKTTAVKNFQVLKNAKDVRSYLGVASFYRRLVPMFAQLAKPMTALLRKDAQFVWGEREKSAFDALKTAVFRPGVGLPRF